MNIKNMKYLLLVSVLFYTIMIFNVNIPKILIMIGFYFFNALAIAGLFKSSESNSSKETFDFRIFIAVIVSCLTLATSIKILIAPYFLEKAFIFTYLFHFHLLSFIVIMIVILFFNRIYEMVKIEQVIHILYFIPLTFVFFAFELYDIMREKFPAWFILIGSGMIFIMIVSYSLKTDKNSER